MTTRVCEHCGTPFTGGGAPLCDRCLETNEFAICAVCGAWEVVDTLRYEHGDDLGGWCLISEGPETYCPEHRPANLRPGAWDTRDEARGD